MSKVTIVGGGLTGVLAAFEAHRLGARDIVLHERFDQLGGVALPRSANGLELRDGCMYFGPSSDPIRALLEAHGAVFEDIENRYASVNPGRGGELVYIEDLGSPGLPTRSLGLTPQVGNTLADRLRAYPEEISEHLTRYCQWHLGTWLNEVHESAVVALSMNRVLPLGPSVDDVAALKAARPLYDELYAVPRANWTGRNNLIASLPRGGFGVLFAQLRRSLSALGVAVHDTSLVSPRQALAERAAGDTLVWAANPMPLFKPLGLEAPTLIKKSFATYVFKASYAGQTPFYIHNFTATGSVFRVYLYESRGQLLALAECVQECGEAELRREIVRLMAGFGGASLSLGEQVSANVGPRWVYHSVDAMQKLKALRARLTRTHGAAVVPGAWEPYAKGEKFAEVNAGLAAALDAPDVAAVA